MDKSEVLTLFSDHADALNLATETTSFDSKAWLSTHYPAEAQQVLMLLQLAQAIKWALVPLSTPQPFRTELKSLLSQSSRGDTVSGKRSYHGAFLWGAAALGLLLLVLRRLRLSQGQQHSHSITSAV